MFNNLIGNKEIEGLKWTGENAQIAITFMAYLFAYWTL